MGPALDPARPRVRPGARGLTVAALPNAAVGLETRRFLASLVDEGTGLDQECVDLMERVLVRVRPVSPCGWVFLLADALGAARGPAMAAASFAELFYAMCSFTDDVQDGDAARYMKDLSPAMRVNVMMQLLCVTAARGRDLSLPGREAEALEALAGSFEIGAVMLRGQRYELTRERWSVARYRKVAELSAGRQFEVYLGVAALAARADPSRLLPLAAPLGILVQLRHDESARDDRLSGLSRAGLERLRRSALADLVKAARRVPRAARGIVATMVTFASGKGAVLHDRSRA